MQFWSKMLQLAPLIITTGAAVGLLTIKVQDPKTERIIRVIALLTALGTAIGLITQLPTAMSAIDDVYKISRRMLGWDEDSQLDRLRKEAAIQAEREKAAEATRAAAVAAEQAQIDLTRRRLEREAAERAAAAKAAADAIALDQAAQKAKSDRAESIRRQNEATARAQQEKAEADARLAEQKRIDAQKINAYCNDCCSRNAPPLYRESKNAVPVCITECTEQKSSNWFGNGGILCRR